MKKNMEKHICMIPIVLWFVIMPLIVKEKYYANPLKDHAWYSAENILADFFLYYKSLLVTLTGCLMLILLFWQISKMRRKDTLLNRDIKIFTPIIVYLILAILSSLFSEYGYFCTHGMPDQFETIWNLIAYVIAVFFCYYIVVYQDSDKLILSTIFIGVALVEVVCVLQFFKIDIYRLIYAGKGYSFTFEEGTVYGPFYNTNYVGFYSLLFVPLFLLLCICYKDWKIRVMSAVLAVALLISMIGAKSVTASIAMVIVLFFSCAVMGIIAAPRITAYMQSTNTEKTNLENIFTNDDNVEIDYKGQKLYIQMWPDGEMIVFLLKDQNQSDVAYEYRLTNEYYYYEIVDDRFSNITLIPTVITDEPLAYGFIVQIDNKNWCFTNQMTDDGTYYYRNDLGMLDKLDKQTVSADFSPLVKLSGLATGRGYIWNKTLALLKNYILFGSGADTFALVYPNGDYVDKYNNNYDNLIITKPHNLYLQIAVQTGLISLICFLVFYIWYFISSVRIYFNQRFDRPLTVIGFAIMLGTFGYMISGLANDSTVTISPLYWALLGIGIGVNRRIRSTQS